MSLVIDILGGLCLALGSLLCLTGSIGLLRLPDFYSRLYGAGISETLGTPLILLGLVLFNGLTLTSVKLVLVAVFVLLTNPTATHAMSRAALHAGQRPVQHKAPEE